MSQIKVSNLTFGYEGSPENVFEETSFSIDTNWKLGFIGRNGKGKTTFLKLLLGGLEYTGSIVTDMCFDYFPYPVSAEDLEADTAAFVEKVHPDGEFWKVCRELELLHMDTELLFRPLGTLSHGERTRVMLAVLFSRDNYFLLIDEPTNHLDARARELVRDYLRQKKGFILVSHDRWLLDGCVDHVLVLERNQITIEKGNFSSWRENKERRDQHERAENEKLKGEITKLHAAAARTARWAEKVESSKIGFDPRKEHDRSKDTRAYIGEKSRRMQQRRKNLERRQQEALEEKEGLLKNLEETAELKLQPLRHYKDVLIRAEGLGLGYCGAAPVLTDFNLELRQGDRVVLVGANGCGKTTLLKEVLSLADQPRSGGQAGTLSRAESDGGQAGTLSRAESDGGQAGTLSRAESGGGQAGTLSRAESGGKAGARVRTAGSLYVAPSLTISYINQDTSHLRGSLRSYIEECGLSESLVKAILRQIGFERTQFERSLEEFSEGQKKKVLIAASLAKPAHLYIWDEPLNYIDVFSRMQIEKLILDYCPTMLIVEHDRAFAQKCGTQVIALG